MGRMPDMKLDGAIAAFSAAEPVNADQDKRIHNSETEGSRNEWKE